MAKRGTPSKRAQERAALQIKFKGVTLVGLQRMLDEGRATINEISKYYTDARAIADKRIKRVMSSDVPFVDAPPVFLKGKLDRETLLHEVASVNAFLSGQNYGATTIPERRKVKQKAINTLHKHGITWVNSENFNDFAKFQKWFKASMWSLVFDSDSERVGFEIFKQAHDNGQNNSTEWERLFQKFIKTNLGRKTAAVNRGKRRYKSRRK